MDNKKMALRWREMNHFGSTCCSYDRGAFLFTKVVLLTLLMSSYIYIISFIFINNNFYYIFSVESEAKRLKSKPAPFFRERFYF